MKRILAVLACSLTFVTTGLLAAPPAALELAGTWQVQLDPTDEGLNNRYASEPFPDPERIRLPGTLAEAGLGTPAPGADRDMPTYTPKYVGSAWYRRDFVVPDALAEREFDFVMERVNWRSRVWVDGRYAGTADSLATAHRLDIGPLDPGRHTLTIQVDNGPQHNLGDFGHAYCKNMQKLWNGIVGRIELVPRPRLAVRGLRVFPAADARGARVELALRNGAGARAARVRCELREEGSDRVVHRQTFDEPLAGKDETRTLALAWTAPAELWDEFHSRLYRLSAALLDAQDAVLHEQSVRFGFRTLARDGNRLLLNGRPLFIRGNSDAFHFPATGYPSCSAADWKRIFQIYKDHGLNLVRFHSCCPPAAAFEAADELGLLIQAEAGVWIDGWMGAFNPERPDMYDRGGPQGIGRGDGDLDDFVRREARAMLDAYGNSPSFAFFALGNELGPSNFETMGAMIREAKEYDPRRLYLASTARQLTPADDYMVTHNYPDVGWVRQRYENHTDWDYEALYSRTALPTIAHEIGQWPVYPDWSEIPLYTGPIRPLNLIGFRDIARRKGTFNQTAEFHAASGFLSALLYKDELEAFLRTPSCRGYQLLGMQDYAAQGEALIGWLDSFYRPKGTLTAAAARRFCGPTVPLLRLPKYAWAAGDAFAANALVRHEGAANLTNAVVRWSLTPDGAAAPARSGEFPAVTLAVGAVTPVGEIRTPLDFASAPARVTLTLSVAGTEISNQWNFWVFPAQVSDPDMKDVLVTEAWDETAKARLAAGGKVVLLAHGLGTPKNGNYAAWMPVYWSPSFLPTEHRTIGLLLRADHPALAQFPTGPYGDWQWRPICAGARGFILNALGPDYRPIAQPVCHFHDSDRLGTIFELAVGRGKLLVCGYNLTAGRVAGDLAARQLRRSLLAYAAGPRFAPRARADVKFLDDLFRGPAVIPSADPGDTAGALLDVSAAAQQARGGDDAWSPALDTARAAPGAAYTVRCTGTWKDAQGTYWHGKTMRVTITVPRGARVSAVYARFRDPEGYGRAGTAALEGRHGQLGNQSGAGYWAKFEIQPGDTADGRLVLETQCTQGANLMLDRLVVAP